jgi:signal transduction histidine kinase
MRRFTANASHELRTPLTALRATGQAALASKNRVDDFREAVADMLEDAEQLSRVLETMSLLAQDRDQRLSLACTAGPAAVDPTVIRIAVANILHNAIRYSPPSSHVAIRAFGDEAAAIIEVEDRGPGIAQEHHAHLFERFYRVDPGRSRALGGVGLGLAMARWSVEAHGGQIQVDSREGAGSTFRIVLPQPPAPRLDPQHPERLDS